MGPYVTRLLATSCGIVCCPPTLRGLALAPPGPPSQTLTLSTAQHGRVRAGRAATVFPLVWLALALVFSPDVLFGGNPLGSHLLSWTLIAGVAAAVSLALRPRGPASVRWQHDGVRVLDQAGGDPLVPFARIAAIRPTRGLLGWGLALVLEEGRTVDVLMRGATRSEVDAWVAGAEARRLAQRALDPGAGPSMMPKGSSVPQEPHATV